MTGPHSLLVILESLLDKPDMWDTTGDVRANLLAMFCGPLT